MSKPVKKSKRITRNDDGTVTCKLKFPVEMHNRTLSEIILRTDCRVSDLEAMDAGTGDIDKTNRMIAELSELKPGHAGISVGTVRKLHASDWMPIAKEVGKIIGGDDDEDNSEPGNESPQTGESS